MIGANATIEMGVVLRQPVIVGPHARIGQNSTIKNILAVIERSVRFGEFVDIGKWSIIHYNTVIDSFVEILSFTVIGPSAHIGWGARIGSDTFIGGRSYVGVNSTVDTHASVAPTAPGVRIGRLVEIMKFALIT